MIHPSIIYIHPCRWTCAHIITRAHADAHAHAHAYMHTHGTHTRAHARKRAYTREYFGISNLDSFVRCLSQSKELVRELCNRDVFIVFDRNFQFSINTIQKCALWFTIIGFDSRRATMPKRFCPGLNGRVANVTIVRFHNPWALERRKVYYDDAHAQTSK